MTNKLKGTNSPGDLLINGSCRCLAQETQRHSQSVHGGHDTSTNAGDSNQEDETKTSAEIHHPTAVLISERKKQSVWLCRWSQSGLSWKEERILCFHKSVAAHHGNRVGEQQRPSKSESLPVVDEIMSCIKQKVAAYAGDTTSKEVPCGNQHAHIAVQQRVVSKEGLYLHSDHIDDSILALFSSPTPLQSLTVRTVDPGDFTLSPDPLQHASWKRQLVGVMLLFREAKFTSTVHVCDSKSRKIGLRVESLTARAPSSQVLFVVLPSTRISLIHNPPVNNASTTLPLHFPRSITAITQLLLDTIICTHQKIPVPRTFLLSGPAGVGKTYSVQQVQDMCPHWVQLVSLRGSEILQSHSNASQALEQQFRTAVRDKTKISLLFLDECDALVTVHAVASTLAIMLDLVATQWSHVLVVGATNRIDSLPGFLRRAGRFDKEIPLSPPNVHERAKILFTLLEQGGPHASQSMVNEIQHIAEQCVGYVPADLNALVRRAALIAAQERLHPGTETEIWQFLKAAMHDVGPSALRDAAMTSPPQITWEDIAGDPGGAKTALRQAIEWPRTKATSFAVLGLVPPRGILLHGPPGCAKTTLARAAAGASGVAFLSLSPAEVYASSYVGEAEAVVRRAFSLARSAAPCVLFFDEIDSIFGGTQNEARGNSAEARVLSTFLNEMDGVDNNRGADGVLVLAATNRPWTLDSALLRPGRLGDKIIYIPPPDESARRAILQMQFQKLGVQLFDIEGLASDSATGLMTGAEVVGACQEAKLRLLSSWSQGGSTDLVLAPDDMSRLLQDYFRDVLKSTKPLLSNPVALNEFRLFEQLTHGH